MVIRLGVYSQQQSQGVVCPDTTLSSKASLAKPQLWVSAAQWQSVKTGCQSVLK